MWVETLSQKVYFLQHLGLPSKDDFRSISSDFMNRYHVGSQGQLYLPGEPWFPKPLKYGDVIRLTETNS